MTDAPKRLAVVLSHPIHYFLGLFRELAREPGIELMVYLCSDFGMRPGYDETFGRQVIWYDQSILDGVPHRFLKNRSDTGESPHGFWTVVNPDIVGELRRSPYDAVLLHGYTYATNYLAMCAAKSVGTRVLLRGESNLLNTRPVHVRAAKRLLFAPLFGSVDAFLSIGTKNHEYYRHYGVPERKLFAAPYTVDNAFYQSEANRLAPERGAIRRSLGIPENACVILFASKLIDRKRPMDALRAFEAAGRRGGGGGAAYLIFAGDGPERQELERYAADHAVRNVHFTGFVPPFDLPRFYAVADVFLFPSGFETWGLVVNEAMNFGLPILTTDMVGSSYDLVRDGENGFVHRVGDIETLSARLAALIGDEPLRRAMGATSRERISRWSYHETIRGIRAALQLP